MSAHMRIRDLGACVHVLVTVEGVREFMRRWPASGLRERAVSFVFHHATGDLVDLSRSQPDGPALLALSQDAQTFARSLGQFEPGARS